jgi:phosphopantothenoylcysteine synthetase/decarboxylase
MTVHIFGGGTIMHVRSHFSLCAPARGRTARALAVELMARGINFQLHLTSMADPNSELETNYDVERRLREVLADPKTTGVIFNVALCDFEGKIGEVPSGKYAERLQTRAAADGISMDLRPTPKLLGLVRELRPDVKSVGFKTTAHADPAEQLVRANRMAVEHGIHWMLANDVGTRNNIVLTGGGATLTDARYNGYDREAALAALVDAFAVEVANG